MPFLNFQQMLSSINTEVEMRDNDLKSANFFDVATYPKITFKSTSIKPDGQNKYKLTGNLTMHGVTKAVTMDLWYRGTTENPMSKKPDAGFKLTGTLKRSDFNIGSNTPSAIVSDEVEIKADGEFGKSGLIKLLTNLVSINFLLQSHANQAKFVQLHVTLCFMAEIKILLLNYNSCRFLKLNYHEKSSYSVCNCYRCFICK